MEQLPPSQKKPRQKPGPKGPSTLTPQRQAKVCRFIRRGVAKHRAAILSGTTFESLRLWEKRGAADLESGLTNAYTRFFAEYRQALAEAFLLHERAVADFQEFRPWDGKGKRSRAVTEADARRAAIMEKQAKLGLGVLRIRDPKRWGGPAVRMEHSGPAGAPLPTPENTGRRVDFSRLTGAEYSRYQQLAEVARGGFEDMAPELTTELQALLRKALGQ